MRVKEMNQEQRPREKALRYGIESLSDTELLALILGSGTRTTPVMELAAILVKKTNNLADLIQWTPEQFMEVHGIREVKALQIIAGIQLTRRSLRAAAYSQTFCSGPEVIEWLQTEYGALPREAFVVLFLDSRGHLLSHQQMFTGTQNQTLVSPRDIFREACLRHASSIIVVHNHPGGSDMPSPEDIEVTRRLQEAGETMGVSLADHLIVTRTSWFSMRESQLF